MEGQCQLEMPSCSEEPKKYKLRMLCSIRIVKHTEVAIDMIFLSTYIIMSLLLFIKHSVKSYLLPLVTVVLCFILQELLNLKGLMKKLS